MANILRSAGGEWLCAKSTHPSLIRCCNSEFRLKRRQVLLASTSVRVPSPGLKLSPNADQGSNLTNCHSLHDAQTPKFKHSSDIDVASLFTSSDSSKGSLPVFSGTVSVPSQHYSLGNYDFVQARVARPTPREGEEEYEEEVIILEGIKVQREKPLWFDVYIRPGGREEEDEYAGSFIHRPPRQKQSHSNPQKQPAKGVCSCCLRLGINDIMDDFDAQDSTVIVTLVPKFNSDKDPITVENICMQYS